MHGRPRGSIGSPPGQGAVAHADRSAPDWIWTSVDTGPRQGPVQGPGMFCPETLGPPCGWPGPHTGGGSRSHSRGPACTSGGPGPTSEVRTIYPGSGTNLGGLDCISRGPALSRGGPDSLLMLWSMPPSLDTWRLRTRPCGRVGRCCGPRIVA
jgi:hypothetical protein